MKPIQTAQFLFYPRQAAALDGMEAVVSEPNRIQQAGPFYFGEPAYRWHQIKEDAVLQVPFEAWAVARIAFLTATEPAQFVGFDAPFLTVPLEIQDHAGQTGANLVLRASWQSTRWEGFASSVAVGQSIMRQLEQSLEAEPLQLRSYEWNASGRDVIGWNGQRFLGAKEVRRMALPAPKQQREFRIAASARRLSSGEATGKRFTDAWPPIALLETLSNWVHAYDEENNPLKPASNQRYVSRNVAYTAGDVWFADGRVVPCLIALDEGLPRGVTFFAEAAWDLRCYDARFDLGVMPVVALTKEQETLFPLRVVSRLAQSARDPAKTIRFEIGKDGWMRPWNSHE